jgi:hypothetical protein
MRSLLLLVLVARTASADPLAEAIAKTKSALSVDGGKLAGPGADVLRPAITAANFVMLGEDHGIAQIPAFGAALCAELAPHGFRYLALEVGPSVAPELQAFAAARDSAARAAAFVAKFPETIAFYDRREELAMLAACSQASATAGKPLQLWGVDQELMGAPVYVLPQILATKPGPESTAAIRRLMKSNDAARAQAAKTGDYGKLFLVSAAPQELDDAKAALAKDGTPAARQLFDALLESRAIYLGQQSAQPYLSNRERARLMKRTFLDDLSVAAKDDKQFPHVLVKLGAWHMYRGLNPLRSSELGNMIGEAAEAHAVEAVNILALGVKGQQLAPQGVARPQRAVALDLAGADSDFKFLAPFFAAMDARSWTLFDLRPLRVGKLGSIDAELERVIFGYDFLLLIPDPNAEHAGP